MTKKRKVDSLFTVNGERRCSWRVTEFPSYVPEGRQCDYTKACKLIRITVETGDATYTNVVLGYLV